MLLVGILIEFERKTSPVATFWEGLWGRLPLPWGHDDKGEMVERVTILTPTERVRLDSDRLGALYAELGEDGAEDMVCRAMEELSARLAHAGRLFRDGQGADLRKNLRSVAAIAEQIGLRMLAQVARDVIGCIDSGDANAMAATLARLMRIGDRSLTEVWNLQDMSI